MRRTLRSALVVLAALFLLADASPAAADPPSGGGGSGRGSDPPPDFEGEAGGSTGSPGSGGTGPILPGSSATHCTAGGVTGPIVHVPPPLPQEHYWANVEQYYAPAAGTQGTWWQRYCGTAQDRIVFVPGATNPVVQDLANLVELTVSNPDIQMSPDEGSRQLVGLETWLWIGQWGGETKTAPHPLLPVTIEARPEKVVWDLGDGSDPITCTGGGTPYDPDRPAAEQQTSCSHVFRRASTSRPSGRFTVQATVHWSATVSIAGVAQPEIQTATKTSTLQIRVGERQALNRTPRRT